MPKHPGLPVSNNKVIGYHQFCESQDFVVFHFRRDEGVDQLRVDEIVSQLQEANLSDVADPSIISLHESFTIDPHTR